MILKLDPGVNFIKAENWALLIVIALSNCTDMQMPKFKDPKISSKVGGFALPLIPKFYEIDPSSTSINSRKRDPRKVSRKIPLNSKPGLSGSVEFNVYYASSV